MKTPDFNLIPKEFDLDEAINDHNVKIQEASEDAPSYLPETHQEPEEKSEDIKQHDASPVTVQPEPKTDKE